MKKFKTKFYLKHGMLLLSLAISSSYSGFASSEIIEPSNSKVIINNTVDSDDIKIEYLMPTYLNISANGINRFSFGKSRIVKIVGDGNQYEAMLAENGSNLFITSKVAPNENINLTLLFANGEAMDLRLFVSNNPVPAIIRMNLADINKNNTQQKTLIKDMINKMALKVKGKYFVEEKKRALEITSDPNFVLNQYATYRYGDFVGAAFTYSYKNFKNMNYINGNELITSSELKKLFKDVVAIAINKDQERVGKRKASKSLGRVFIIYKAGEERDV